MRCRSARCRSAQVGSYQIKTTSNVQKEAGKVNNDVVLASTHDLPSARGTRQTGGMRSIAARLVVMVPGTDVIIRSPIET
jgi:hypothetical protein